MKPARICIDPGHPSETGLGARGRRLTEIAAAWRVGKALEKLLKARGIAVRMTKAREGQKVTNRRRAEIANRFHADLMVRLHCDSEGGTGFAVYYPDHPGTDRTGKKGPTQRVLDATAPRARAFYAAFSSGIGDDLRDNGLHGDRRTFVGGKQGALTGSIWSEVPVVLVEMCVLTNPDDEAYLTSAKGVSSMSAALAAGIEAALAVADAGPERVRPRA